jgi:Sulfotransferase domain
VKQGHRSTTTSDPLLPTFFIVGAPKCGTTSLAQWLGAHASLFMSVPKEPHFFSCDLNGSAVASMDEYRRLFEKGKGATQRGEGSTWYLFSRCAVPAIEEAIRDARYIVLTRDPTDMAVSLYNHNVRTLAEDQTSFQAAWDLQAVRAEGMRIPKWSAEPAHLQYRAACSLGSLVARLRSLVPDNRILHIAFDDLKSNPGGAYLEALGFLGLSDDGRQEFSAYNQAASFRSRRLQILLRQAQTLKRRLGVGRNLGLARRLNERQSPSQSVPVHVREMLEREFAAERQLLKDEIHAWQRGRDAAMESH